MATKKQILEDVFDMLNGNTNHITPEQFRDKYDCELDYQNNILTVTSTDNEEEYAVLSLQ